MADNAGAGALHRGFVGRYVLAPMVRSGELPTRMLCLKYGATAVWGPEVVDKGILECQRIENPLTDTIDWIKPPGPNSEERVVFRTHKTLEKETGKCIFQIGTATPELAVQGAKMVAKDVAGIDVNAGCPKHFSIHSGMGAALLKTPDTLCAILTALIKEVGEPYNVPVGVKIRILDDLESTLDLVRRLCATGIVRLTVHCRTTPMRPREPAIRDYLPEIRRVCHEANVKCYANGDVRDRAHADELIEEFGVDGCMMARAAEANPSCFREGEMVGWQELAKEFMAAAQSIGNYYSNTKFCLTNMLPGKDPIYQAVTRTRTMEQLCEVLELPYNPVPTPTLGLPPVEKPTKPVKPETQAVKKAKKENKAAKAAGGKIEVEHSHKKLSERGVQVAGKNASPRKGSPSPPKSPKVSHDAVKVHTETPVAVGIV